MPQHEHTSAFTIWFADKTLRFSAAADADGATWPVAGPDGDLRAKVLNFFETGNRLTLQSDAPEATFSHFAEGFVRVTAAGGLVFDPQGRGLLIYRNGRWDLPKGKIESGESLEACALREVSEETGLTALSVTRPLGATFHAYDLYGRWELKQTWWYAMRSAAEGPLRPEGEEGIERAEWFLPEQLQKHVATSFPTIQHVWSAWQQEADIL